jgi:hypothetical protein
MPNHTYQTLAEEAQLQRSRGEDEAAHATEEYLARAAPFAEGSAGTAATDAPQELLRRGYTKVDPDPPRS